MNLFFRTLLMLLAAISFAACGGGDNNENMRPLGAEKAVTQTRILKGTAASGARIVGKIHVKGAKGNTVSKDIEKDGKFTVDVSGLSPNFILRAEGTSNGESIELFSFAVDRGAAVIEVNVTPVTNLLTANTFGKSSEYAYEEWETFADSLTEEIIKIVEESIKEALASVLEAAELNDFDLMGGPFEADGSGFDALLDSLNIEIDGGTAIINNIFTDETIEDDISDPADESWFGRDEGSILEIKQGMADNIAIHNIFRILEELYENSSPGIQELTDVWGVHMAEDFFESSLTREQLLAKWARGEGGPAPEECLFATITGEMGPEYYNTEKYSKGKWITIAYWDDNGNARRRKSAMVFNGEEWLWYGNRQWVESLVRFAIVQTVNPEGKPVLATGLRIAVNDDGNYAYDQGVRSGIVTGPGLPEGGVILDRNHPAGTFSIFAREHRSFYPIIDDALLKGIRKHSSFTISLYLETPDQVSLEKTAVNTFTQRAKGRKVFNKDLKSSLFPAILTPQSHDISTLSGSISVVWDDLEFLAGEVRNVSLSCRDGLGSRESVHMRVGEYADSVTFELSPCSFEPVAGEISLEGRNEKGAYFETLWKLAAVTK